MRKNVFGRQLKRDTNERKALFKNLMSALVLQERIKTTEQKAKAVKGSLEKLVTKAKKGNAKLQAFSKYLTLEAAEKLFSQIAPRFTHRPGGYLRIVRLSNRFSDNASMVLMEWVEGPLENKILNIKDLPAGRQGQKENKKEKVSKVSKVPKAKEEKSKKTPRKRAAKK